MRATVAEVDHRLARCPGTDDDVAELRRVAPPAERVHLILELGAPRRDRALLLNPNLANAWNVSGWVRVWRGEPEVAIEHLARATRLSPLDPLTNRTRTTTAHAHFFAGRYDEAASWAAMTLREWPDYQTALRIAAASYALAGPCKRQGARGSGCKSSIPGCASRISRTSSDPTTNGITSPGTPKACARPDCLINRSHGPAEIEHDRIAGCLRHRWL